MPKEIKLLHLSYDPILQFELRVPKRRLMGEDAITPRICLSTDIESAINAKVGRASALSVAVQNHLPLALYVYTTTLQENTLVPPTSLYKHFGVKDAVLTQEYWAVQMPSFCEQILMVESAEFEMEEDWPSPRVLSVSTRVVRSLPKCCFQRFTAEFNQKSNSSYMSDTLLANMADVPSAFFENFTNMETEK